MVVVVAVCAVVAALIIGGTGWSVYQARERDAEVAGTAASTYQPKLSEARDRRRRYCSAHDDLFISG